MCGSTNTKLSTLVILTFLKRFQTYFSFPQPPLQIASCFIFILRYLSLSLSPSFHIIPRNTPFFPPLFSLRKSNKPRHPRPLKFSHYFRGSILFTRFSPSPNLHPQTFHLLSPSFFDHFSNLIAVPTDISLYIFLIALHTFPSPCTSSSSPIGALIGWVGVDGFALCSDPFFFVLYFLSLFLALLRVDPAVAGWGMYLINYYY